MKENKIFLHSFSTSPFSYANHLVSCHFAWANISQSVWKITQNVSFLTFHAKTGWNAPLDSNIINGISLGTSEEKISELDTTFWMFPHFFLALVGLPFCPPGRYCSTTSVEKSAGKFKILYRVLDPCSRKPNYPNSIWIESSEVWVKFGGIFKGFSNTVIGMAIFSPFFSCKFFH